MAPRMTNNPAPPAAAKAPALSPDDELPEGIPQWTVLDRNARKSGHNPTGIRIHEDALGVSHEFAPGVPVKLPRELATKFLKGANFEVRNEAGVLQTGAPDQQIDERVVEGKLKLEADETIAKYDELTRDALLKRANARPGGETLKVSTGKDDIIAFLMTPIEVDTGIGAAVRRSRQPTRDDGVTEDMAADEVDAMFNNPAA